MKRTLATLALLSLALEALAGPGFFRSPGEIPTPPERPALAILKADPCSLMIRYTPATVGADVLEIHYNGASECRAWWRTALDAAMPAASLDAPKVSQGPAEAPPSVYTCAINVNFSAATAGAPTLIYTGAGACESTRTLAIARARLAMQQMCSVDPVCI